MKLADYQGIIDKLGNPDLAAEGLVELNTRLSEDEKAFGELETSVNTLRDTNAKLALSITRPAPVTPPEPDVDYRAELGKSIAERWGGGIDFGH